MRVAVDLADRQLKALDDLAKARKQSRAALVREAIRDYLATRPAPFEGWEGAFGLWGNQTIDGLDDQRRIREEW